MLLPLFFMLLFFGGSFILLTRLMLLSVRTVMVATAEDGQNR